MPVVPPPVTAAAAAGGGSGFLSTLGSNLAGGLGKGIAGGITSKLFGGSKPNPFPLPPPNYGWWMGDKERDANLSRVGISPHRMDSDVGPMSPIPGTSLYMDDGQKALGYAETVRAEPHYQQRNRHTLDYEEKSMRQRNTATARLMDKLFPGTTPWERLGSGQSSGAGSPGPIPQMTTPSGNLSGPASAAVAVGIEEKRLRNQLKIAAMQSATQIESTKIASGAKTQAAETSATATVTSAQLQTAAAELRTRLEHRRGMKDLQRKSLEYQIARERGDREAVTQSASFLLHKIMLHIRPENVIASAIVTQFKKYGMDVLSPDGKPIPQEEFEKILLYMRGEESKLRKGAAGVVGITRDVETVGRAAKETIEATPLFRLLDDLAQIFNRAWHKATE